MHFLTLMLFSLPVSLLFCSTHSLHYFSQCKECVSKTVRAAERPIKRGPTIAREQQTKAAIVNSECEKRDSTKRRRNAVNSGISRWQQLPVSKESPLKRWVASGGCKCLRCWALSCLSGSPFVLIQRSEIIIVYMEIISQIVQKSNTNRFQASLAVALRSGHRKLPHFGLSAFSFPLFFALGFFHG